MADTSDRADAPRPEPDAAILGLLQACQVFLEIDDNHGPKDAAGPVLFAWQRMYRAAVAAAVPDDLLERVAFPSGLAGNLVACALLCEPAAHLKLQGNVARLQAWCNAMLNPLAGLLADLVRFAEDTLKGKERQLLQAVIAGNGRAAIEPLSKELGWEKPWDNAVKGAMRRVNIKLSAEKLPCRVVRKDNEVCIHHIGRQ